MKNLFTILSFCLLSSIYVFADDEPAGIYLSGTMNNWAQSDPAWELKQDSEIPGWAYIDISAMPAGTEFRIVGHGRDYGMKNTRNTIRQNSMHLLTLDGEYNLTADETSLDGIHLMIQSDIFTTDKYIGLLSLNDESQTLYGVCMESSVTPSLLEPIVNTPNVLAAEVEITEPWFVVKAYQLSNATQTVCNYGLSDTDGVLTPTSNLAPTAPAIPVPDTGAGKYMVTFNFSNYRYTIADTSTVGIKDLTTDPTFNFGSNPSLNAESTYFNLQGMPIEKPEHGLYIERLNGSSVKHLK